MRLMKGDMFGISKSVTEAGEMFFSEENVDARLRLKGEKIDIFGWTWEPFLNFIWYVSTQIIPIDFFKNKFPGNRSWLYLTESQSIRI